MVLGADFQWAGRAYGWRYLAQRIDGTGAVGAFLEEELPLSNVQMTDVVAGPPQLTAVIDPVARRLKGTSMDYPTILKERGTLIHAEQEGQIQGSFLLDSVGMAESKLSLDCTGLTTVAQNIPYPTSITFTETDPLTIIRHMWQVIQADPDTNVRLAIDLSTFTDKKVGHAVPDPATSTASQVGVTQSTSSEDNKPYELNWWSTHNLGDEIDKLCAANNIEYHERHTWNSTKTDVNHYLDFGYPAIGIRREGLRFILGENIQKVPTLSRGTEFANHVIIFGAGEGSEMIRAEARVRDGRVRTVATLDDKSITDQAEAYRAARLELMRRQAMTNIAEITMRDTPMAALGSFGVGDEIRTAGITDWSDYDIWARVLSIGVNPDDPSSITAQLLRSDWVVTR